MIANLKGVILNKSPESIVLDVNGVGYEVAIPLTTYIHLPDCGESFQCMIQTIVREDAFALYGFIDKPSKDLFNTLIKISGIGSKVALGILSSVSVEEFLQVIFHKDAKALVKLPGIGKKTAERLVLELSSSKLLLNIGSQNETKVNSIEQKSYKAREEAAQALASLGYPLKQAEKAVANIDDGQQTADSLIRLGLNKLSAMVD